MDKKSVYQIGAEKGVVFGLYLTLTSVATIFADKVPLLSLLGLLLLACIPVIVYVSQRRQYLAPDGFSTHGELWMYGVVMNIGGAAICALASWFIIRFLRPNFLVDQVNSMIEIMESDRAMRQTEFYKVLSAAVDKNFYPKAIDYVMQMFWMTSFIGSLGSALTAWLAVKKNGKSKS